MMWVFLTVFLLSRIYRLVQRLKKYKELESPGQLALSQDADENRQVNYDYENDSESEELKLLRIEEQKIKNVIAEEKLALDRQKRVQSKALHEMKMKKVAKLYGEELKEPEAWFS